MNTIRFRRLNQPEEEVGGVKVERWELAFDEDDLHRKLGGEIAEVIMPAKPWYIRLWRKFFPLRGFPAGPNGTTVTLRGRRN